MGDLTEDEVGGSGPFEGTGSSVVGFEVVANGGAELGDAQEVFALEALAGEFGEEAFDLVEPGRMGGDEVQVPAGMAGEPANDRVGLVSGVVVEHGVDLQSGRSAVLDLFEESEELPVGVPGVATAPDLSGGDAQRGEERDGAVAEVIVRVPLGPPQVHRQDGLGAFQGLYLALLVHTEDHRVLRRALVKPHHVADLFHKERIGGEREGLLPMRLKTEGVPDTADGLMRHARFLGEGARAPMRRRFWLGLERAAHDSRHLLVVSVAAGASLTSHSGEISA
jgi:hypothetical protein